jgi:hypothetical protein
VTADDLPEVKQMVLVLCCQKCQSICYNISNFGPGGATVVSAATKQLRLFSEERPACRQHGPELKQGCISAKVHIKFLNTCLTWYL